MSQAAQERLQQLRERADAPPPVSFKPEALGGEDPEELIGFFTRLEQSVTEYGPVSIAVLTDAGTGEERSVWLFHAAIKSQFAKAAPKVGDLVLVRYLGKQTPKGGGKPYHNWRVVSEAREGAAVNWGAVVGDQPPQQQGGGQQSGNQFVPEGTVAPDFQGADDDIPF